VDVDDGIGAERAGELELLVPDPVRDDRGGRVQASEPDGERAHRADPDDADGLGRLDPRAREGFDDERPGLYERGCLERHVVGQHMEDPLGDDDELAPTAATGEADRVVPLAEVCVSGATTGAAHAADVPLADDALAGLDGGDAVADGVDDTAPLVTGHEWKAHPA
jgi:hypothetical protein